MGIAAVPAAVVMAQSNEQFRTDTVCGTQEASLTPAGPEQK